MELNNLGKKFKSVFKFVVQNENRDQIRGI